ncbi:MAG: GFA family protein [Alphaproteobacteria bacterium]|nr:GFA family protein [Alphaproteobacteria bacterium]
MASDLTGGCSCGAIRYRLTAAPIFVHCCHCTQCQRLTGSAFVVNALIETSQIEMLSGEPQRTDGPSESGRPHDIYRCAACHTAVWSDYGRRGYLRFVRVGTLDDPSSVSPDVHIFTRSKQPWVNLSGGAPAFDVFYEMNKLWPPEALARRKAAAGG